MSDPLPDTEGGYGRRQTLDDLLRCAAEAGAIVLKKDEGSALLLDRYAQRGMFVSSEEQDAGGSYTERLPAILDHMASQAIQREDKEGYFDIHVHVVCGRPRPNVILEALTSLLQVPSLDRLTITLHVAPQSQWWRWAVDVCRPLARASASKSTPSTVFRVLGTLDAPPEFVGNEIIRAGIGVQYVWMDGSLAPHRTIDEQQEAITALANFGFRVPVAFYVHEDNAEHIHGWVQKVLDWNLQSGFTVYPGEHHPVS